MTVEVIDTGHVRNLICLWVALGMLMLEGPYCENRMKHMKTLSGQNAEFLILNHMVHMVTTVLDGRHFLWAI
jgi:hypothetical protein